MSAAGPEHESDSLAARGAPAGGGADGESGLSRRLAAGERGEALRALSDLYAGRVYDLALTILGDPGLAERLTAETISEVASRASELEPVGESGAPNLSYEIARRRASELAASESELELAVPDAEDFEALVADVEFRAALAGLGDEGRGVLEGVLGEGLTRAEVGERMGLTVGIVELRLRAALRAVRDELGANEVASSGRY